VRVKIEEKDQVLALYMSVKRAKSKATRRKFVDTVAKILRTQGVTFTDVAAALRN